jgi:hypothetical protein
MPTLHPITGGIRNGRHQHYPTPNLQSRTTESESVAEEIACRMFLAYHSVSFLRLVDETGEEVRTYRRCDFFQHKSPLREVHHRVALALIDERTAAQKEIGQRMKATA